MPGIYLADDANCSRPLLDIEKLVQSFLPQRIVFSKSFTTGKGYRFDVTQESDVNLFFTPDVLGKLHENQLTPDLCKDTQKDRVLFIADVNLDTFYKNESAIKDLICEANNISILKVNKFVVNNRSRRRYIKISLDSKDLQTRLLTQANLKLDQVLYPVEAPHSKNGTSQPFTHSQTPVYRTNRGNSYGSQGATGLSPHSFWGDEWRSTQQNPVSHGSQQVSNTPNSRAYPEFFSKLCEALYQGLKHPDKYILIYNQMLIQNGYQEIKVPQSVLDVSSELYLQHRSQYSPPELLQPPDPPASPPPLSSLLSPFPLLSPPITTQPLASAPPLSPLAPPVITTSSYTPLSLTTPSIVTTLTTSVAPTPASTPSTASQCHSAPLTVTVSSSTSNSYTPLSSITAKRPSFLVPTNSSLSPIQSTYSKNPLLSTGARVKSCFTAPYSVSLNKSSLPSTPSKPSQSPTPTSQASNYALRDRPVDQLPLNKITKTKKNNKNIN